MDDLISEFITETSESLGLLDSELVKLEQNPNDKTILGNIFRLVHTIKGTCGFLGLPRLESVAHAGENVLGKIRDGAIIVTPEAISLVLGALDTIKTIMEYLAENGEEPAGDDKPQILRLNAFADSNGASAGGDAPAPAAAAPPAPAVKEAPPVNVVNMLAPDELKVGGGTVSASEMDALEAAFAAAAPTVEGGHDFSTMTDFSWMDEAAPAAAVAEPAPVIEAAPVVEAAPAPKAEAPKPAAPAKAEGEAKGEGSNLANQSIRVSLDVLENLMQMVGELVLTRNQLMQVVRNRDDRELKAPLQTLSHITTELQEGVMKTRMQPIGNAWSKFPRLIRDLSMELNKKIDLKMVGEDVELDRQLLEMIKDPLTHMVRNSCDHGLERPEDRLAAGKSETGTVKLSAYHQGGHIIIEIADDGRGLNMDRIKAKIIENGLGTQDEIDQLSDETLMQYIFKAGFSTAEKVTSVSGRGVGMDVVRTNIEKIGGTVELQSKMGKGSTFLIKIPLTLAIVSVLIVDAGGERFAIPQINVLELVKAGEDSDYPMEHINDTKVLRLRDKLLPLTNLRDMLQLPDATRIKGDDEAPDSYIVVVKVGNSEFGIIVDRVFDTEEIVVKPVSELLKSIPVYSGNTILGDGSVIMILDPNGLAREVGELDSAKANAAPAAAVSTERMETFLVFRSGPGAPKAVPLELVSRLEQISTSRIEYASGEPVVQYRDDLMRLKTLQCATVPTEGNCSVVVFTYDNRTIGMVVDSIVDIIEAPLVVRLSSENEEYVGSMVIDGKSTDVIDVGFMLKELMAEAMEALPEKERMDGYRLLFVDDSLFFRNLTVPYLSSFGYDVTAASLPSEAISLAEKERPFDVIVTDVEMPEMDGVDLAERLRAMAAYADVPMIAFTSTINDQLLTRARAVRMSGVVLKNNRDELMQVISGALTRTKEAA